MAPGTKPTPGKGGPQRSIQSFFTKSPAKALVESSPGGKNKTAVDVDAVQQVSSKEKEEKKVGNAEAKSVIKSTPGKRKDALEVGHDESPRTNTKKGSRKPKLVIGAGADIGVDDVAPEDEVTPLKRRRLRKVRDDSNSDSVAASSPESKVGRRLKVYWPLDKAWYEGCVKGYDASEEKHIVLYDDGEEEGVDIVREKVEWLPESEEMGTSTRGKRHRSGATNSKSGSAESAPAATGTNVEVENGDTSRRGRAKRQIQRVDESDDGDDVEEEDDDEDDADFHVVEDSSEDKESEVDDEDDDDELDDPEGESDSDEKPRKRPKKTPSSAVKKPRATGSQKLSKPTLAPGGGSGAFKISSLAKSNTRINSGRLDSFLGVSNDCPSSGKSALIGEASERFGSRDSEKFKFLGK